MKNRKTEKTAVTLDSLVKTMLKSRADGEKLKNKSTFTVANNSVALFCHAVKGKQALRLVTG